MRLAIALALAAPAFSQTAAIVHILSDELQVPVGRTLKVRAVVRDAAGKELPAAQVAWSVNRPNDATIAADGTVVARGLATIRVTARSGTASGEAAIQTIPTRVEVTPDRADMEVGTQYQFRATAYDANGGAIPGITWTWSVTNRRQGGSSLAAVDQTGMVRTTGEGGIWVWATYNYNESFPGLQRQWVAYSPVEVSTAKKYEMRRLFSTARSVRPAWNLRAKPTMLWSTDDGSLLFNASLGGLANALLAWKEGRWKVVSAGGAPRFGRASKTLEFRTHTVTRDGRILTYEDTIINGAELNRGTVNGVDHFLSQTVPLAGTENSNSLSITRNSMTSTGWVALRGSFRFENTTTNLVGLFRGGLTRINETLVHTGERLDEAPGTFTVDTDYGVSADGTAVYSVTAGSRRVFYKHPPAATRQKLIAVGDPLLGGIVRRFLGGQGNSPSFWQDEDGTTVLAVELEDLTQHMVAFSPGGSIRALRVNSQSGVLYMHPGQGILIYANPYNNQGNGAWLWRGDTVVPVLLLSRRLFDQAIQALESGAIDKDGNITLILRGDVNPMMVARMGPDPYVLFAAGEEIPVELPVNLFTLVSGARVGPPHFQAGGNNGSIAELSGGQIVPRLPIGERLFGNTMWFGGSHGTSTYNMRKAPNGDIFFTNGSGIGKISPGGEPVLHLRFPIAVEGGVNVNTPGQIDVNAQGAIVFQSSTSAGDNRILVWHNGQARQLLILSATASTASTIDNRIAQSMDSVTIDDTGRVMAQLRFRNVAVPVLCVWEDGQWRTAAMPNETRVGAHLIAGLNNTPRAAGNRLLAGLTNTAGAALIGEWRDGWQIAVDTTTVMPNGQVANSVSNLDGNTRGDYVFQFANNQNTLVVRRGNALYQVHNFYRPTTEGDYLIRINHFDFRDDGTVYILAVTAQDDVVLYEARPLF